jgi:hypothetical protein
MGRAQQLPRGHGRHPPRVNPFDSALTLLSYKLIIRVLQDISRENSPLTQIDQEETRRGGGWEGTRNELTPDKSEW